MYNCNILCTIIQLDGDIMVFPSRTTTGYKGDDNSDRGVYEFLGEFFQDTVKTSVFKRSVDRSINARSLIHTFGYNFYLRDEVEDLFNTLFRGNILQIRINYDFIKDQNIVKKITFIGSSDQRINLYFDRGAKPKRLLSLFGLDYDVDILSVEDTSLLSSYQQSMDYLQSMSISSIDVRRFWVKVVLLDILGQLFNRSVYEEK